VNLQVWAQVGPPPGESGGFSYPAATTDAAGRYTFGDLPAGYIAVVQAGGPGIPEYEQVCVAARQIGAPGTPELDLEITSRTNPQPSSGPRPLVVSGQVYEMTSAGRMGVAGAHVAVAWNYDSWLWGAIFADADGRYAICGIPAGWKLTFVAGLPESGFEYVDQEAVFHGSGTFDLEVKRNQ
jgi:hypothetical protein